MHHSLLPRGRTRSRSSEDSSWRAGILPFEAAAGTPFSGKTAKNHPTIVRSTGHPARARRVPKWVACGLVVMEFSHPITIFGLRALRYVQRHSLGASVRRGVSNNGKRASVGRRVSGNRSGARDESGRRSEDALRLKVSPTIIKEESTR